MSELVPYTAFETDAEVKDAAIRMHDLVVANTEQLGQRNLLGPISRYGRTIDRAIESIRKGQTDKDPNHRFYVDDAGNIQGSTSIYTQLQLTRPHFGLPPALAPGLLSVYYRGARPNVHAWVADNDPELLTDAYSQLVYPYRAQSGSLVKPRFSDERPWTLEPDKKELAPVHAAIAAAGLLRLAVGRFNDGEATHKRPSFGVVYGVVHARIGEKVPAYAQHPPSLKELRTGQEPWWRVHEEIEEEMISRNPKGA